MVFCHSSLSRTIQEVTKVKMLHYLIGSGWYKCGPRANQDREILLAIVDCFTILGTLKFGVGVVPFSRNDIDYLLSMNIVWLFDKFWYTLLNFSLYYTILPYFDYHWDKTLSGVKSTSIVFVSKELWVLIFICWLRVTALHSYIFQFGRLFLSHKINLNLIWTQKATFCHQNTRQYTCVY